MRYLLITLLVLGSITSWSQAEYIWVTQDQVQPWFPVLFQPEPDSIFILENTGRDGGTFKLLLAYPGPLYQPVDVTYNDNTKESTITRRKVRTGGYLKQRFKARADEALNRLQRDSILYQGYILLGGTSTPLDTSDLIEVITPPQDTTGN